MKKDIKWPKHFFLIGSDQAVDHQKPSPNNMGSKAFNLLRMSDLGLTVPSALVIGTHYTKAPKDCLDPLFSLGLPALERMADMQLGDPKNPLILSVRSGAPVSMPGMMETLLNIGLTESTLGGFLRQTGKTNRYRRSKNCIRFIRRRRHRQTYSQRTHESLDPRPLNPSSTGKRGRFIYKFYTHC